MLFGNSNRDDLRRTYLQAWQRHQAGLPLEPLAAQIADVIALHPEYHALFARDGILQQDFTGTDGQSNPFLHLSLHLAIREQVSTRRPRGIESVHRNLCQTLGDQHSAEHRMIEVLAQTLWEAQQAGKPPDEERYLQRLRRLGSI
jgi:hypothetical protein